MLMLLVYEKAEAGPDEGMQQVKLIGYVVVFNKALSPAVAPTNFQINQLWPAFSRPCHSGYKDG
jgi:hypothetical protein